MSEGWVYGSLLYRGSAVESVGLGAEIRSIRPKQLLLGSRFPVEKIYGPYKILLGFYIFVWEH